MRASRPAHQLIDRQAQRLARNVPQGDVHGADGLHRRSLLAVVAQRVVHLAPQDRTVQRVAAQYHGKVYMLQNGKVDMRIAKSLTPACNTGIGGHFQQQHRSRAVPCLRVAKSLPAQLLAHHVQPDAFNLHCLPPLPAMRPG